MKLTRCTSEALHTVTQLPLALVPSTPRRRRDSAEQEQIRKALGQLRSNFVTATGGGVPKELADLMGQLVSRTADLPKILVGWVDVVEALVQEVESQQGEDPGSEKKRVVKDALVHLLVGYSERRGREPSPFEPLLFEMIADWSIDAVVRVIDKHKLWEEEGHLPPPSLPTRISRWLFHPLRGLRQRAARRISRWVLSRHPISPELQIRIEDVVQLNSKEAAPLGSFFGAGLDLVTWVGQHRKQVVAIVQVVALTVDHTEGFFEKTGAEKKIYARNLIIVFLQEEGLVPRSTGPGVTLFGAFLDGMIDAMVHMFDKRAGFSVSEGQALDTA